MRGAGRVAWMSNFVMRDTGGGGQPCSSNGISELSCNFQGLGITPTFRRKKRSQPNKKEDEDKPEVEKSFKCEAPGCQSSFSSKFKLDRHVLIHSGVRRFECSFCGRRFHRKDHLKNHCQVHNPNKTYHVCDKCKKKYSSYLSYKKHLAFHSAEDGYPTCLLCGEETKDKEAILQHVKIHNGSRTMRGPSERKFPCDRCDKSFFTRKDVKRHNVVHTGNRDFSCQFCPQRFGRKDHLVRHRKKSHPQSDCNSPLPPLESISELDAHILAPKENGKLGSHIGQPSVSDLSLMISHPVPVMEAAVTESVKHESYISSSTNIMQPAFGLGHLTHENNHGIGRFGEAALLPVTQYMPINPSYTVMPPHYMNIPTSNGLLSDLLSPMTAAPPPPPPPPPPFQPSMSLDMGSPPLPHFSQAFQ